MNNLDPALVRLRELEARIDKARFQSAEQCALVETLRGQFERSLAGLDAVTAAEQLHETMQDTIAVLELRRLDALRALRERAQGDPGAVAGVPDAG